jgi:hypothetical protein
MTPLKGASPLYPLEQVRHRKYPLFLEVSRSKGVKGVCLIGGLRNDTRRTRKSLRGGHASGRFRSRGT